MTFAEFSQSIWGKVAIALALFLAGYYFPLFGLFGTPKPSAIPAASAPAVGVAGSQPGR